MHMNIFILKKSLTDLKNPLTRSEYVTYADTVGAFICEMVQNNYEKRAIGISLDECRQTALDEFVSGGYYIINQTKDIRYATLDQNTEMSDGDEIILIKLKYVRGIIW